MLRLNWGKIGTIGLAVGTAVMAFFTTLSDSKQEEQTADLIKRVDCFLSKLEEDTNDDV